MKANLFFPWYTIKNKRHILPNITVGKTESKWKSMNPGIWQWLNHNWWGLLYRQHQRFPKCSYNLCTELVTLVKLKC